MTCDIKKFLLDTFAKHFMDGGDHELVAYAKAHERLQKNEEIVQKFMRVFREPLDQEPDEDVLQDIDDEAKRVRTGGVEKAQYQGREVTLDKPFRTPGESKKFAVYVKDGDNVKIVRFGDPNMEIKRDDPEARASFRARHKCDTQKDKTKPAYWSCRMWDKESVSDMLEKADFTFQEKVCKIDEDQRLVFGWASVVEENGKPIVDHQGDVITPRELVKAAHGFIISSRAAKVMHEGEKVGEFVESMVFTKEVQDALGIDLGKVGWWLVLKVENDSVWSMVKNGKLKMFSIGGKGQRIDNV